MGDDGDNIDEFVTELTRVQVDLFYFIRALTGDMHAAMDIRQSVNMVLWKKREKFQRGTSFKNWSFQVAQLEVKNFLRAKRRSRQVAFDEKLLDLLASEFHEAGEELSERRVALSNCLTKLTAKDEELLRHRYWSNATLDVLAERTQRSAGTLKARLHQLRASLRRCIESQLEPERT
ncbi:sigma-70 family RNA polymerase sigma factor [Luteolibacter marinus]|uniref:sigma-70 family RNA polymerase sigma factor n=1 Tax=Luteolibacter marinus TaxID=2776705 RepID=UPI001865E681|nr:sigma-70 family RNA polymerase sigma factor [Luteolibacter marinus]